MGKSLTIRVGDYGNCRSIPVTKNLIQQVTAQHDRIVQLKKAGLWYTSVLWIKTKSILFVRSEIFKKAQANPGFFYCLSQG
jgi:hypothetical protein